MRPSDVRGTLCVVTILLMLISSTMLALVPVTEAEARSNHSGTTNVEQFGSGFDETIIADAGDSLNVPRDLEFHPNPSRADELWVINRATDSMTIIFDAGEASQSSINRKDRYANHFMEEPSAFAFGQSHAEFDYIFASAQETRNTYDGQNTANDFMGPALWPSALSHFAMENQANNKLGSHLDMLHESPNGVGIAHDSGNAYWYNDGWYGELVYYNFQSDHDTGGEDHADGIVRRYTEITPTRQAGVPGHMILDKSTGILYIADTGMGRVLWVDTDDTTTTTTNRMGDNTQKDSSLAEYSEITGVDNGVLASGLNNPSGIALHNDTLFVSERGNGKIRAYALDGTLLDTAQTTAQAIMGLEVGPDNKLWYVDATRHQVIRMDPFPDIDGDGIADDDDNCPSVSNSGQDDHDSDDLGDICDPDDDNDGILSDFDDCVYGDLGWTSGPGTDHDGDGCRDSANEDPDDDNDGRYDSQDGCPRGDLNWVSGSGTDHDMDGCRDDGEDLDDDGDTVCDGTITDSSCTVGAPQMDRCPRGAIGWTSSIGTDFDNDGCRDSDEDADDDDDGYLDTLDGCPKEVGNATEGMKRGCPDWDGDGWADAEDTYAFDPTQWVDTDLDSYGDNVEGTNGDACPLQDGTSTADRFGCPDSDGDGWSNPTGTWTTDDGADAFALEGTQWHDSDIDGYGDNWNDTAWNSERVVLGVGQFVSDAFQPDACPAERGYSWVDRFGCSDVDGDGMSDAADAFPNEPSQMYDLDGDGYGDNASGSLADGCPDTPGTSTLGGMLGCPDADGDGWADSIDLFPALSHSWSDADGDNYSDQEGTAITDECPEEHGNSTADRLGCLDQDGDGTSDQNDFYPLDASKTEEELLGGGGILIGLFIGLLVLLVGGGIAAAMLLRRGREEEPVETLLTAQPPPPGAFAASPPQVAFAPPAAMTPETPAFAPPPPASAPTPEPVAEAAAGPPVPAEGLPPGWTMEQWGYYGEGWLRDNQ